MNDAAFQKVGAKLGARAAIALGLFGVIAAITCILGVIYLSSPQFMPYHREAVGQSWGDVPMPYRALVLALMRLTGVGWLLAAAVMFTLIRWAAIKPSDARPWHLLAAVALFVHSGTLYATLSVASNTGASTPWRPTALLLGLAVVGWSMRGRRPAVSATTMFLFTLSSPTPTLAQPNEVSQRAYLDPQRVTPFRWHEILRGDMRPRSPLTEQTLLVQPAAPLNIFTDSVRVAALIAYRLDTLTDAVALSDRTMHRFEVGLPTSVLVTPRLSVDIDLRGVYASSLDAYRANGWYPNLRAGVTWSLSQHLALSTSLGFTRSALGLLPLPTLGIAWRPSHRFRIEGLLPRSLEIAGRPFERLEIFVMGHWEAHAWAVSPDHTDAPILTRQEVRTQVGARARFFGPLALEVATHWTPFQAFDLGDSRTRPRSLDDFSLSVALVLDRAWRVTGL